MKRLFLVCPDCYMEQKIRAQYGSDSFFLTALGSVFHIDNFKYAEEVNSFLSREDVMHIYIVNDVNCTFIQNALSSGTNHKTKAEIALAELYLNNIDALEELNSYEEKAMYLAKLNIYRQANDLRSTAFLGSKIESDQIALKGVLYHREKNEITEIEVDI